MEPGLRLKVMYPYITRDSDSLPQNQPTHKEKTAYNSNILP